MRKSILRAQARAVSGRGAVFHASAALHRGRGILFFAPSGGGKSTAAAILSNLGLEILGDDSTLAVKGTDGVWRVIPCASFTWQTGSRPGPFRLGSIVLLEKGEPGHVLEVSSLYASYRILREESLMAYDDLEPYERPVLRQSVIEVCSIFPCSILRYSRPDSLARLIERIE